MRILSAEMQSGSNRLTQVEGAVACLRGSMDNVQLQLESDVARLRGAMDRVDHVEEEVESLQGALDRLTVVETEFANIRVEFASIRTAMEVLSESVRELGVRAASSSWRSHGWDSS